jgi:anionic cell wall polymer biosynthesis LytR-Cps2A-Psr (LCP) family protein
VSIDFNGFVKAVDSLGGIEIDVKKTFDDYVYPIKGKETDLCDYPEDKLSEIDTLLATEEPEIVFPCRYEHLHFDKGLQTMDGTTALKYVRSRHGFEDGGDFGRASRQQEFLLAFKKKMFSIQSIPNMIKTGEALAPYIQTDVPPEIISKFVKNALSLQKGNVERIILSEENVLKSSYNEEGGYILIPKDEKKKWKSIHEYVQMTIDRISPTPTPSLTPTKSVSLPVENQPIDQ